MDVSLHGLNNPKSPATRYYFYDGFETQIAIHQHFIIYKVSIIILLTLKFERIDKVPSLFLVPFEKSVWLKIFKTVQLQVCYFLEVEKITTFIKRYMFGLNSNILISRTLLDKHYKGCRKLSFNNYSIAYFRFTTQCEHFFTYRNL